jgi:hypothetical protein
MLDTIRAFVLEELAASGEQDAVHDLHTAHFAGRMRDAGPALWSPDTARVLDELESDHDNLRTAARHMLAAGQADELAAACAGSWLFWVVRGHLTDPLQWVDAALAGADLAPATRARLHYVAGWTLLPRGHHDEAVARFDDAARLARDTGMETDLAWTLLSWAHAEVYRGRPARAAELLAPAGEIAERQDDVHALSCVLIGDAHVAIALGAMEAADELLTANLPDIEARGAPWPLAVALGIHGRVAAVLGDHVRAAGLLTPSVRIFGDLRDTWGMAHQLTHVADVAALLGDATRAALLYGAVDGLAHEVGARVFHVWQELSDHCQARALAELGVDRYTQLRRSGRLLTPAEVVDLAAGRADPDPEEPQAAPRGAVGWENANQTQRGPA